jgi:predicted nucleic acid-binding protein
MRDTLSEDPTIATAEIAAVEIKSALWRRRHRGEVSVSAHHDADAIFADLSMRWREIVQSTAVTEAALRLLTRHPLKALDALQLASAIVLAPETALLHFVTLDKRLAAAARAEGFPVLP